jgi:hypothetical protein
MPEDLKPFGILSGRGVVLADNSAVAWVDAGGANLDVRVNRRVARWGSGTNTGLSFRVVDPSNYFFAYTADSIASPGRLGLPFKWSWINTSPASTIESLRRSTTALNQLSWATGATYSTFSI